MGDEFDSVRGRLLVATPDLLDPNFARTVVLVLEHSSDGALGIVLNRPSDTDIVETFPAWRDAIAVPSVAFVGGPVASESVIALARGDGSGAVDGWMPVLDDLGTVNLEVEPGDVGVVVAQLRVFAGYAGWAPDQLEAEIDTGGWWVFDAARSDPFSSEPAELWAEVLGRQGGIVALYARCPIDPSVN